MRVSASCHKLEKSVALHFISIKWPLQGKGVVLDVNPNDQFLISAHSPYTLSSHPFHSLSLSSPIPHSSFLSPCSRSTHPGVFNREKFTSIFSILKLIQAELSPHKITMSSTLIGHEGKMLIARGTWLRFFPISNMKQVVEGSRNYSVCVYAGKLRPRLARFFFCLYIIYERENSCCDVVSAYWKSVPIFLYILPALILTRNLWGDYHSVKISCNGLKIIYTKSLYYKKYPR